MSSDENLLKKIVLAPNFRTQFNRSFGRKGTIIG